ncbi:Helix-turn-helix transcriptional regulator [Cohnella lubricantis]|uniref:Helix-turn-helix transcriptional regulator n=1 Tax=Cohnella lubricantis TaxID=2163172 RepID=A0A841TE62_9BACL|nr:helix-turn-helix transcriptional regulator [Cohnella lubricantis]MBP2119155.1 transcriptional regulator with XRE-family HTH domain [Cohnella lubricantis]
MGFDYQAIGNRIRKARERKGITQELLAESMDVSNAYISKIERGRTPVNLNNLDKICRVLETSTEYILSGTSTDSEDYMKNEIMELLEGCSPQKIRLIVQVIKPIVSYREDN